MERFPVLDKIFSPFVTAIRKGDLKAYDQALEKYEPRLLELNLWLSLEKARELCLRGCSGECVSFIQQYTTQF